MRRRLVFATVSALFSLSFCVVLFFAADTYGHWKFDPIIALNREGYRGPVLGKKPAGVKRVIVLGGSTVLCPGQTLAQTWPGQLQSMLPGVQVINLGWNAEGAYGFIQTLQDYAYLQPDLVILYEGYNDLTGDGIGVVNTQIYRHQSPLFRWFGYYAVLPLVVHEKLLAVASGGQLDRAYRGEKVVFHPSPSTQVEIAALQASDAMNRQLLGYLTRPADPNPKNEDVIAAYVAHELAAIAWADSRQMSVLVVGQPNISPLHRLQQQYLVRAMHHDVPHLRGGYLDTTEFIGDLSHLIAQGVVLDGMHLTPAGNAQIAHALKPTLEAMLR